MGRSRLRPKEGLKNKGAWTPSEDKILIDYVKNHGEGKWSNIPKITGLRRYGKSCRLRWLNYLRPGIKKGKITPEEEDLITRLHKLLGNRWSLIAGRLPGRTDNEIKNFWNKNLRRAEGKQLQYTKNKRKIAIDTSANVVAQGPSEINAKAVGCGIEALDTTPQQEAPEYNTNNVNVAASSMDTNQQIRDMPVMESIVDGLVATNKDEDNPDFMMDFILGDTSIAEFLDTDFAKLNGVDTHGMDNGNKIDRQMPVFSSQAFSEPEQCCMDSDLASLAAFIDSTKAWFI